MTAFFITLALAFGLSLGSFANALVYRVHRGATLWGRSMCVSCHATLRNIDLLPVVSFLLLKGKCRDCQAPISLQYPLVEGAMALLFVLLFLFRAPLATGDWGLLARDLAAVFACVIIFLYDALYMEIPDVFSLPAIVLVFLLNSIFHLVPLLSMLIGLVVGGGIFLFQYLASRGRWVGGGDIRLGAFLGVLAGFPTVLVTLFMAYILGSAVALPLLLTKRAQLHTAIPFGMFLTVAGVATLFVGPIIVGWYRMMLGY